MRPPKAHRDWTPPSAIPGAHVCRATPVVPVRLGAPQGAPAFVQTLAGEGGPRQVRPCRGRPRARGAPPPPVWLPPASQRGALFVSARGPGPRGRPGASGRAGEGGALPTCLCEAEPGAPWVL